MKRLLIYILLLPCFVLSCTKRGSTTDSPAKLLGQKLILPANISMRQVGEKDTIIQSNNIKLVTYYAESDCTSCSLKQLNNWEYYITQLEQAKFDVNFIVIIDSKRYKNEVKTAIAENNFTYPIFLMTIKYLCHQIHYPIMNYITLFY